MSEQRQITRDDIMPIEAYGAVRKQKRGEVIALKRQRRMDVGPLATFHFENYQTMWSQVHEMLWIEKGGDAQIADELAAYNPLIPKGDELVATMMFEIDDPVRRNVMLRRLTGVEGRVCLDLGDDRVQARPEIGDGVDRTKEDGKTSSIHFLRFPFTAAQVDRFRDPEVRVILAIEHENYAHMAVMPAEVRAALAQDFD